MALLLALTAPAGTTVTWLDVVILGMVVVAAAGGCAGAASAMPRSLLVT